MFDKLQQFLQKKYPQNYIIRNSWTGGAIVAVFWFLFIVIYKPLQPTAVPRLGFYITMAVYTLVAGLQVVFAAFLIRKIPFFSNANQWNLIREITAIFIILFSVGVAVYFFGFLMEPKEPRWNFATFFDSCLKSFMVGIIPFAFFSLMNYRFLNYQQYYFSGKTESNFYNADNTGKLVQINSKLKKEHLEFFENEFIYAESEGNYVIFYLFRDNELKKKMIRNALNDVEEQLSSIETVFRSHRAFLVNLAKISKISGNSLGYRLTFKETTNEVPVSRKNTTVFKEKIKDYALAT